MIRSFTTAPDGRRLVYCPGTIRPETVAETACRRLAYRDRPDPSDYLLDMTNGEYARQRHAQRERLLAW